MNDISLRVGVSAANASPKPRRGKRQNVGQDLPTRSILRRRLFLPFRFLHVVIPPLLFGRLCTDDEIRVVEGFCRDVDDDILDRAVEHAATLRILLDDRLA
jgi:hypothetical protein